MGFEQKERGLTTELLTLNSILFIILLYTLDVLVDV